MKKKLIYTLTMIGFFSVVIMTGVLLSNGKEENYSGTLNFTNYSEYFKITNGDLASNTEFIGNGEEDNVPKIFINCTALIEWMKSNETYLDYTGITSIWAYKCLELKHISPYLQVHQSEFSEDLESMKIEIWVDGKCMGYCLESTQKTENSKEGGKWE